MCVLGKDHMEVTVAVITWSGPADLIFEFNGRLPNRPRLMPNEAASLAVCDWTWPGHYIYSAHDWPNRDPAGYDELSAYVI